jgi:cysteine desulfurase
MTDPIYLDNQATTPTDPRVLDAMLPLLTVGSVGNPHSEHVAGRRAKSAVENAREQVAKLIGARPEEVIFTSGATEANNLALQGIARSPDRRGNHIVTCPTEHKCVLETMSYLGRHGFRVEVSPVDSFGLVDVESMSAMMLDDTSLVSIMMANNEIGVLQPIAEIAAVCQSRGIVFHSDAAQAVGKIPVDVKALGVDLMSLSGHKLYAPIGIGALYVSDECPMIPEPVSFGVGQERGIRSGTISPVLCVALGAAAAIATLQGGYKIVRCILLFEEDGETPISRGGYKDCERRHCRVTMERPRFRGVVTRRRSGDCCRRVMERPSFRGVVKTI